MAADYSNVLSVHHWKKTNLYLDWCLFAQTGLKPTTVSTGTSNVSLMWLNKFELKTELPKIKPSEDYVALKLIKFKAAFE